MVDNWNGRKVRLLIGCGQTGGSRIHCLCHKCLRTCQGTWPNPTSFSSVPAVSSVLLSFSLLFLSYVFDSAPIGIPFAIRNSCSCTLSNNDDLARFLFPIYLFPRFTLRCIFRDSPILFSLSNIRLLLFFIFCSFFISFRPFSLICSFDFVIFSAFFHILFHFFLFLDIFSRIFRHESTTLFFDLFLLFFSLICLFRIFRIRFSARAFYISFTLFHASFPFSSTSSFTSFSSSFSLQQLPSLISLFLSFSLLRRPRFTLIAHKEK